MALAEGIGLNSEPFCWLQQNGLNLYADPVLNMNTKVIDIKQLEINRYADKHNPCCAGCDWWRWHNPVVGDCTKSAPVSGGERFALLGITWTSLPPEAGHVMTPRHHKCGDFKDEC